MIFSAPCCDALKNCLICGDEDRALVHLAGEKTAPLAIRAYSVWGESGGRPVKAGVTYPILFCPFCGERLQTREGVEDWQKEYVARRNRS